MIAVAAPVPAPAPVPHPAPDEPGYKPVTKEILKAAEEAITTARFRAAAAQPYMRTGIMRLRFIASEYVPTLATDESWRVFFNPRFTVAQPVEELATILLHELWHGLRSHHSRARALGIVMPPPDAPVVDILNALSNNDVANLAEDMELNDDLAVSIELQSKTNEKAKLAAPQKWQLPEHYKYDRDLMMEEYYHKLQKDLPKVTMKIFAGGKDGKGFGMAPCGGIAGNPTEAERKAAKEAAAKGELSDAPTPAEIRMTQRSVAEAIQAHARNKGRGCMPAGQLRWAEEITGPERVPWRSVLASAVRHALAWVAGLTDYSFQRLSRRSDSEFTFPGLRHPLPNICLIADTSGSVSARALGVVVDETKHVLKSNGQRSLKFFSVDAGVAAPVEVFHARQVEQGLLGGGGTDMRLGFEAAEKLKPRPNITVLFTDGVTPWPDLQPKCGKIIIVLVDAQPNEIAIATALGWAKVVAVDSSEH